MEHRATPAQMSAFLVSLRLQQFDCQPEIVAACATVMRDHALYVDFSSHPQLSSSVVDIVGTGGDGHNTFNVSTSAAIIAAGAGSKVAKHGNRASSSSSGSADLLESLSCVLENVTPPRVPEIIDSTNFCFLFSQVYHPAMRQISSTRKEIGVPTIFNILGPLSSPAKPSRIVLGVHSYQLGHLIAEALNLMGVEKAFVVNGSEGLDEISPELETHLWELSNGEITERKISPDDFGLPRHSLSLVAGGDSTYNAKILNEILDNKYEGPILDFILINTSALLVLDEKAADFKEGVALAREAIRSGKAKSVLSAFASATQSQ
ncbi:anthranilate phosphoribosyltransferase [Basidiobolus meristosporus CBS 931.73]|uniref:Anthranilate phosphoribosyltransferase n=1 Tax=Basidiobolus meristosporus CBS 931.73 TaxID=1314790 RepID=A0A1Y1XVV1_9FUNG|nr:anthranilate phosphoribosyltransferase [Basidiobolus meristosporus CBS 931.73]|eukprot:ORX89795.1 anthranilate phosphoribosyltransferase [Basidiobolus meristosporus CBS 931.73]